MKATYPAVSKGLHWLVAVLVGGLLALGFYMTGLPLSPQKLQFYSWHKWAGVSVFALAWVRLAWRWLQPAPPLPDHLPPLARMAAHAGHAALYLLMLAVPLSGWLMSSAKGVKTVWFGVVPLPDLLARDRALGETLAGVHGALNWLLLALIAGHVAAALFHHFVHKDGTLHRMLPARA